MGLSSVLPGHGGNKRARKKRSLIKDHAQIQDDMKPGKKEKLENQPEDQDLPGMGQYYCISCARHFISKDTLDKHAKTKAHKRRLKELKTPGYTQAEAEAAVGMGTDHGMKLRSREEEMKDE